MAKTKAEICKELIKDYCANCSFAGVHFIADDTKHWIERLLWVVLIILSWYGSALLIASAFDAFHESPISFGVETTYTDWDTKMPTVAVCETANKRKLFNVSDTIWPPGHLLDLEDVLNEIVYFRGVAFKTIETCYTNPNPDPLCPKGNYSHLAKLVRSDCNFIMKNCSYNNKEFPCCEYFQPIDTDMGTCFILNSIQTKDPHSYPMVNNLQSKQGVIRFQTTIPSTIYTLGEDEVPTITTLLSSTLKVQPGNEYRRLLSVRNIQNDPLISDSTPEQRACRFYNEKKEGWLYPHYSYSACTILCRKQAQMEQCKCNDHFMVGALESDHCNLSGLACLYYRASHLTTLKPPWAKRPGLTCDCLPSCDETEITVIQDFATQGTVKRRATIEVALAYLPTERFKRSVVRSRLDLVVSVGGTTGLFLGASLLSFAELFFFFTVRFINNLWRERRKTDNVVFVNPRDTRIQDQLAEFENEFNVESDVIKGPYMTSGVSTLL